jgi:hypothetical protein
MIQAVQELPIMTMNKVEAYGEEKYADSEEQCKRSKLYLDFQWVSFSCLKAIIRKLSLHGRKISSVGLYTVAKWETEHLEQKFSQKARS